MDERPSAPPPRSYQAMKAATAVVIGFSLMVLSGLTLVVTVIGLTMATPVLVVFSPVLFPAAITVFMLIAGFVSSGGFGVAAVSVLSWIYRYMTGKKPAGAEQLEHARMALAGKARDMKQHGRGGEVGAHATS